MAASEIQYNFWFFDHVELQVTFVVKQEIISQYQLWGCSHPQRLPQSSLGVQPPPHRLPQFNHLWGCIHPQRLPHCQCSPLPQPLDHGWWYSGQHRPCGRWHSGAASLLDPCGPSQANGTPWRMGGQTEQGFSHGPRVGSGFPPLLPPPSPLPIGPSVWMPIGPSVDPY